MKSGTKHSPETIAKIKAKRTLQISPMLGRHHAEVTRSKISASLQGNIPWNKGKTYSEEHRRKLSLAHIGLPPSQTGSKSHFWKGGLTEKHKLIRSSARYQVWRTHVFQRDNYTCQACGARSGNGKAVILHADHDLPFSLYPDLRFEILNGRTLCVQCRRKTPTFGIKYKTIWF